MYTLGVHEHYGKQEYGVVREAARACLEARMSLSAVRDRDTREKRIEDIETLTAAMLKAPQMVEVLEAALKQQETQKAPFRIWHQRAREILEAVHRL